LFTFFQHPAGAELHKGRVFDKWIFQVSKCWSIRLLALDEEVKFKSQWLLWVSSLSRCMYFLKLPALQVTDQGEAFLHCCTADFLQSTLIRDYFKGF
jgi:hypothetical protein